MMGNEAYWTCLMLDFGFTCIMMLPSMNGFGSEEIETLYNSCYHDLPMYSSPYLDAMVGGVG